jgi:hypothetical protein
MKVDFLLISEATSQNNKAKKIDLYRLIIACKTTKYLSLHEEKTFESKHQLNKKETDLCFLLPLKKINILSK